MIPDREKCFKLLEFHNVPPHIIRHSVMVSRVAVAIIHLLRRQGEYMDSVLAEAGGLLHDIAKMECIETGCDHAVRGAEILSGYGFIELASMVRQHVMLDSPVDSFTGITPALLLNYADKRVRHSDFVSLDLRFDDLRTRYGTTPERRDRIDAIYKEACRMEQLVFSKAKIGHDELRTLLYSDISKHA